MKIRSTIPKEWKFSKISIITHTFLDDIRILSGLRTTQ